MTCQRRGVNTRKRKPPSSILNSIQQEMTTWAKNLKNPDAVARRLALTREILGLTQKEFAEPAGVILSRYNLWETGKSSLHLSGAMALCATHDLTLDWLYRGKVQGLPIWLAVEVAACFVMFGRGDELAAPPIARKRDGDILEPAEPIDEHPPSPWRAQSHARQRRM
jgi:transcriptional regulator with XRE-family HTH domain